MTGTMTTGTGDGELVPLGDGPVATVLAGVEAGTGRAYALKVFPGRLDRRTRAAAEAELRLLSGLRGQAPVLVADRIEDAGGRAALRMDLCTESLTDLIASSGPMPPADAVDLGRALARALAAAHGAGVVHGAVSPGNVLFRPSGEPVLADFGRALREAFPADPARGAGFRAPETLRDGTADQRSDLYGLGAVLHLALSGRAPHERRPGEPEPEHLLRALREPVPPLDRPGLTPALTGLVTELLAKDPGDRPADAAAVAARLAGSGDDRRVVAAAPGPVPGGAPILEFGPDRRRTRLRPAVAAGAAVTALLAVGAGLVLAQRPGDLDVAPAAAPMSAAAPDGSSTAARLTLSEPADRGTVVELTWLSSADLDFAIIVAAEGEPAETILAQRNTRYRVPVEPGRRYCFRVQGTDGRTVVESAPQPIRGAVCRE